MKRFKEGIVGFIIGSILCSSIVYATSNIEVNFLPLKYYFNGIEKNPSHDQQGFIYKNRTYVPLRFMAESLGKDVIWEDETKSIFIGKDSEVAEKEKANEVHTSSNIQEYGEWVYYIEGDLENYNLFKIKKNGTMKTRLNGASTNSFCIVDDWIYFVEEKYDEITSISKMEFYRMKLDGSSKVKIDEGEKLHSFYVKDNIIYYILEHSRWRGYKQLYKINTDGTYKESIKGAIIEGDWIYYTVFPTGNMYKIKTDGTNKTLLSDKNVNSKVVIGDWIYYVEEGTVNDASDWKLRKVKTDKTEDTLITEGIKDFIIKGNWIYFTDRYLNANLYKMTFDGSNKTLLYSRVDSVEAICDNYAIVYDKDSDKKLIRTDIPYYDYVSSEEILIEEDMKKNQTALKEEVRGLTRRGYEMTKGEKIVEHDNVIYFINYEDDMSLYSMEQDGDNKTKLSDGKVTNLCTVDDWIYYTVNTSKGNHPKSRLYKIKPDGSGKRKIVDADSILSYYVTNDTIIYLAEETNISEKYYGIKRTLKKIYRINTAGMDKQLINDDNLSEIQIQNENVYYSKRHNGYLYKSDFEKNKDIQMNKDISLDIYLQDNWIYYRNQSRNSNMYKIRNDGMGRQSISELPVKDMIVKGEWIYYTDFLGNSGKLYKIKTDGTSNNQISLKERVNELIGVLDEWLYYVNEEGEMKRVNIDGSIVQEI